MKIRLAILESDKLYLERISGVFNVKYADKLEVYTFTEEDKALEALVTYRIDVFLAGETFEISTAKIPIRCGFAYFVDTIGVESVRGEVALCKFQKVEMIYKQILSIFSDKTAAVTGINLEAGKQGKLIGFCSASGGCGCSVTAAAFAINLARRGKKVMYLNLETFGNSDIFFQGEGQGSFEDIIYAVKSKKSNLYLKLESVVKRDETGVYFFSKTSSALNMDELTTEEVKRIVTELETSCEYEYIILDTSFAFKGEKVEQLCECNRIVLLSDGSVIANDKMKRMLEAIEIIETQQDIKLMMRLGILYNRFSSHTSRKLERTDIREIGGIKRYEGYEVKQLVQELSRLPVFDAVLAEIEMF